MSNFDPDDPTGGLDDISPHEKSHEEAKSPAVSGEEDPFSGDMPGGDYDINEEMEKVGTHGKLFRLGDEEEMDLHEEEE